MSLLLENPVLQKEMRSRLRVRRQGKAGRYVGVILVGLILGLLYWFGVPSILRSTANGGRDSYQLFVIGLEMTLILFLTPSLAAGSITQEREQQTWNALLLSRLTAGQIVIGKFVVALLPSLLIILLFLPLDLLAAYVGHMPIWTVWLSQTLLVIQAVFLAAMCLFFSWAFRRTYIATAASFSGMAFFVVGTYILLFLWSAARGWQSTSEDTFVPVWLNPYRALIFTLDYNNPAAGPGVFNLVFCVVATGLLLFLVTRRLGRGPKEMEQ